MVFNDIIYSMKTALFMNREVNRHKLLCTSVESGFSTESTALITTTKWDNMYKERKYDEILLF